MPEASDDGERELVVANAAMEAFELDAAVAHFSAAIRHFTAAANRCQAALACVRLGNIYANFMGNLTAGRAWFARATRLVESEEPCVEQGWVAVAAMGCDVDDPADLLARAELALQRARQFGDLDLETKALADGGLAHVQAGRVAEGMALLDEAMALACGASDLDSASRSVCSFFTACCYAADFERASSWAVSLRRRGLIGSSPGGQIFLSNHCDSVQATLLCELGRWGEAEAILVKAMADFEERMSAKSWHPAVALADLRILQGRLADAELLLLGKDGHIQALLPAARLHLARGDHELARATALRGLRAVGDDRLRAAELLAALAEAELGAGRQGAAAAVAADLHARTLGIAPPALRARSAAVQAKVLATAGDVGGAIATLERTVEGLAAAGAPWLQVTQLLALARLREQHGDRAGATVEAKAAVATLDTLDVVLPAREVAFLRGLGVEYSVVSTAGATSTAVLTRDSRWWEASHGDVRVRLPDTKGMRYLAELVTNPGVERHALDLVDRVEGVAPAGAGIDRRHLGDAGEVIDSQARAAYRHRIEALRSEIDDALAAGDESGAERGQGELDQLVSQLAQAFGLGNRARRAASAAERARLNVSRALRAATSKLGEALPDTGTELDDRLRTGLYCAYEPKPGDTIRWMVQSGVNTTGTD